MQETPCRTCGATIALHLQAQHERWHGDIPNQIGERLTAIEDLLSRPGVVRNIRPDQSIDRRLFRPCERGDHWQCVGQTLGVDATIYCCDCYCHMGHRGKLDQPVAPEQSGTCPEATIHDYEPIAWARRKVHGGFDETVTRLQCRHCLQRIKVTAKARGE